MIINKSQILLIQENLIFQQTIISKIPLQIQIYKTHFKIVKTVKLMLLIHHFKNNKIHK